MNKIRDDILSYREMCDAENVQTLQRGMNFRLNPLYSVILMSQRSNAPYKDKVYPDGFSIEYEGHDVLKRSYGHNPKNDDQPVKVYEKIMNGVWSLKGFFDLIDYKVVHDENRNVFRFLLRLSEKQFANDAARNIQLNHSRLIPTEVKKEVWKRDSGKCVLCGSTSNLHFDHELPFSKGGTSLTAKNVRLLCMRHNLGKSAKIE